MNRPKWANVHYPKINLQAISYYLAPKPRKKLNSIDEVDPELLRTFEKLGVPMNERTLIVAEEGASVSMTINGFCKSVFQQLPMEFAVEATKLLGFKLEGSVG